MKESKPKEPQIQIPKTLYEDLCEYFLDGRDVNDYTPQECRIAMELMKKQTAIAARRKYLEDRAFYAQHPPKQ